MAQDVNETAAAVAGEPAPGPFTFAGPGTIVAGYRLRQRIGAGGMGVVYRADDLALDRAVAIKLIQPELALAGPVRDLFVRESLTVAGLEHPHVVPIYAAGEAEGRLFIAMRLIDGRSLRDALASDGPLAPARVARLARQLAAALGAAHRAGVVHRDVKPGNVLLTGAGEGEHAYLTDFGLSAAAGAGEGGRRGGGTPAYCPPEQARGAPPEPRSDIYALSCVLFEALTGRPPFVGDAARLARAHRDEAPPAVSSLAAGLPAGLDAALARGLAKDPADRFAGVEELAEAIAAARHDVLIAHDPSDGATARALTAALAAEGTQAALWRAGEEPESAVAVAASCAVLVGRRPVRAWALPIVAAAERRDLPIVAVMVAGGPAPNEPALGSLAELPWLDLRAAGGGTPEAARSLRRAVAASRRSGDETALQRCPYPGLTGFAEEDAGFFVGRDDDVSAVVAMLAAGRFVAVIGASGSGKSSLVRAGVIPRLRHGDGDPAGDWRIARITPGADPEAALQDGRRRLGATGRRLLVVDQFEEVFTLCERPEDRVAFLDAIADRADDPHSAGATLITLRADFYPRCAEHPRLRELIAAHQRLLGPLGPAGLRRVIEEPATRGGFDLEPGLSTLIMDDAGDDAAALPLVSDLLAELWRRRSRRTLTLAAYGESGGVRGALAARADAIYAKMSAAQQEAARRILLRLVLPGDGTGDARRRVGREDLRLAGTEPATVDGIVDALVAARLLTAGRDPASGAATIEIAHEALIQGWPRLRAWIDADRDRLRVASRLAEAAREWERSGRDADLLARGGRLAFWRELDRAELSAAERAFLDRSTERADEDRRRARRRTRMTISGLSAAVIVVGAVAAFALVSRSEAQRQRDLSESQRLVERAEDQLTVDPEASLLLARRASAVLATKQTDFTLRRALAASHVRATNVEHRSSVLAVTFAERGRAVISAGADALRHWSLAPDVKDSTRRIEEGDARSVTTSDAGVHAAVGRRVLRWDAEGEWTRWASATLPGDESVRLVSATPDGRLVVAAGDDGALCRSRALGGAWTCASRLASPLRALAVDVNGRAVAVDELGRVLTWRPGSAVRPIAAESGSAIAGPVWATGGFSWVSSSGALLTWRPGARSLQPIATVGRRVTALAVSPNGRRAAIGLSAGTGGIVAIYELGSGGRGRLTGALRRHSAAIDALAFDASGERLVSGDRQGAIRLWSVGNLMSSRQVLKAPSQAIGLAAEKEGVLGVAGGSFGRFVSDPSCGTLGGASAVATNPSGQLRAVAGRTAAAPGTTLYSVNPAGRLTAMGSVPGCVRTLAADADGSIVAGTLSGQLWLRRGGGAAPLKVRADPVAVLRTRISSDGEWIATIGVSQDLVLWSGRTLTEVRLGPEAGVTKDVVDAAFSPSGATMVVLDAAQRGSVIDLAAGRRVAVLAPSNTAPDDLARVVVSRDGRWAAIAAAGTVSVFDVRTGAELTAGPAIPGELRDIAFMDGSIVSLAATYERGIEVALSSWTCEVCASPTEIARLARERSTRPLSQDEIRRFQLEATT